MAKVEINFASHQSTVFCEIGVQVSKTIQMDVVIYI